MDRHKAIYTFLFLGAVYGFLGDESRTFAQQSGKVLGKENTILGEISVVELNATKREVWLNHKVILRIDDKLAEAPFKKWMNHLAPVSIARIMRKRIGPFDEVVIFKNGQGTFHCGPGLAFLGLNKRGNYEFSRPTSGCSTGNKIKVLKNSIEVTARPDIHLGRCSMLPIPGGKWTYKQGRLRTIKYVLLRPPKNYKKDC